MGTLCKRIFLFSFLNLLIFDFAQAQTIPGGVVVTPNGIIDLMQSVAGFLLIIGTVLAGIAVLYSGITYMLAGSDAAKVKHAKEILKTGLIGSAIIEGVGFIISVLKSVASNPT